MNVNSGTLITHWHVRRSKDNDFTKRNEESLIQKNEWLKKTLFPWAKRIEAIHSLHGESRFGYRNKVCLSSEWADGGWRAGLRSGEKIIPVPHCPVHHPNINLTLDCLLRNCPPPGQWPMVFIALFGRQLTFVLKTSVLPEIKWLAGFADNPGPWTRVPPQWQGTDRE
jgi:hypothetical protein